MINFKFSKVQMKSSIWIIISFALILSLLSILSMSFTPYFWATTINEGNSSSSYNGALDILQMIKFFGPLGELLAVVFGLALVFKLVKVEISKNYLSSWLSLPMSRKTIFFTKFFTIFLSSFIVILANLLVEFIIVAVKRYSDFAGYEAWVLIKLHLGLLLIFLFIIGIVLLFTILFDKTSHALTLSSVVPIFFIILVLLANSSELFHLNFLQYFKYLTFFSLYQYDQIITKFNYQFIWKFILLLVFSSSLIIGSFYLFKNKNFYI